MRRALIIAALLAAAAPARAQTFRRPTACDSCIANWYYFDDTGEGGGTQDWNCGSSTYEYHRGSDFSLAGGNGAIATGYDVVAAADGTVESSQDGHYDHCTTCSASVDGRCGTDYGYGYGNHVVINHGSYKVIYAHMRNGSIRVGPGDTVRCGDVVGQIASSGCSTGAHLHFETRPTGGAYTTAFDPFQGSCSSTSPTRWTSQGPYRGMPDPACDGSPTCPSGTYEIWTCNDARTSRRRCIDGVDTTEECPHGCVSMPVGTDDVCADPPDADGDGYRADEDCDDGDGSRHPGATETCGDGVDQDCDGADLACPGQDAGPPPPRDGAAPRPDAAAVPPGRDGGSPANPDAGSGGTLTGSCSCRAAGRGGSGAGGLGLAVLALGLVPLVVARRRR
jgi:hypothetical protein